MLRIFMIPLFLVLFYFQEIPLHYLWALVVFALAALTDMLDGKIARSRNLVTDFGKLMDPLADKLLVMAAMLCFISAGILHPVIVFVILAREFLVTSIRLVAAGSGRVIAADVWGKVKTVAQMIWICVGLLLLMISAMTVTGGGLHTVLSYTYEGCKWLVVLLTVASGANYLIRNRELLKAK